MDIYAINSYFNFARSVLSYFNFVSLPYVFWDTMGDLNLFNSHFNKKKKMLLNFGYNEGFFNKQYILLANRGDLNFIF